MATIDALRDLVWAKTNGICELCGQPVSREQMQIDHIVPRADGGADALANYRPAHGVCNHLRVEGRRRGPAHHNWKGGSFLVQSLLRLPPDLRSELEQVAFEEHRTLTNLIVHALREWLSERTARVPNHDR